MGVITSGMWDEVPFFWLNSQCARVSIRNLLPSSLDWANVQQSAPNRESKCVGWSSIDGVGPVSYPYSVGLVGGSCSLTLHCQLFSGLSSGEAAFKARSLLQTKHQKPPFMCFRPEIIIKDAECSSNCALCLKILEIGQNYPKLQSTWIYKIEKRESMYDCMIMPYVWPLLPGLGKGQVQVYDFDKLDL